MRASFIYQNEFENKIQNCVISLSLGNLAFIKELNIDLSPDEQGIVQKIQAEGKSPLIFVQDAVSPLAESLENNSLDHSVTILPFFFSHKTVLAIFSVQDKIRSESSTLLNQLQGLGIKPFLLSGDNKAAVLKLGKELGFKPENCIYEVLPAQKEEYVRKLQDQGKMVAMVGDGINDAPALAKAHLGMVMNSGMDIAMEAGDVVLLQGLNSIIPTFKLSKATVTNIKLSLFWAFIYNIMLIPIAAGFLTLFNGPLLSPMLAGIAMAMSSLSVVLNALRLKSFKA